MNKSDEFEFKKYIPDKEDVEVELNNFKVFANLIQELELKMNETEVKIGYFTAGFYRGLAWGIFRD